MINLLRKKFRYTYINATTIIAVINVIVFIFTRFSPNYKFLLSMNPHAVIDYHMYWQLFTCIFVHSDILHLFFNMFGLLTFGTYVEKSLGSKEYLLLCFICGIFSNALSLVIYAFLGYWNVLLMGYSGVVFSILFAFSVIFPTVRVSIYGIIPVPAPVFVIIFAAIEIVSQFFGINSGVAHMVHLFGFLGAWLYFIIRLGVSPIKIWKNALKH